MVVAADNEAIHLARLVKFGGSGDASREIKVQKSVRQGLATTQHDGGAAVRNIRCLVEHAPG